MGIAREIETELQQALIIALAIDPTQGNVYEKVRVGWQQQGQPGFTIDEDVVFIRAETIDEPTVDRQIDVDYVPQSQGVTERIVTYLQTWNVHFTFYGPNSLDRAFIVRRSLIGVEVHDMLSIALTNDGLFVVPDIAPPVRIMEEKDGQWWDRADLQVKFNRRETDTALDSSIASVSVEVQKENGLTDNVQAKSQ